MRTSKSARRLRIRYAIRRKISGTNAVPRLSVFRSNKGIYAQLIDDKSGKTVASASSMEKGVTFEGTKTQIASQVGKRLAEKALAAGFANVVFDRSGYLYHGRVKALADGAREGGLNF